MPNDGDWVDWKAVVPALGSERIRYLAGRALLYPEKLTLNEIQELAASVVAHTSALDERTQASISRLASGFHLQ